MPRALELERLLGEPIAEAETVACESCPDGDACELQGFCLLDVDTEEIDVDELEELA